MLAPFAGYDRYARAWGIRMRKAVTRGGESEEGDGGRRYWVRAHPPEPKTPAEGAAKRPAKARFLEPYRLAEDRRRALLDCLIAAGIGDPESRDLFATAVEYDIASFRQSCAGSAPGADPQPLCESVAEPIAGVDAPPAAALVSLDHAAELSESTGLHSHPSASGLSPALMPVAAAARALAGLLGVLARADKSALAAALQAADPFQRGYDGGYFDALCRELERIGGATLGAASPLAVAADPPARPAAASAAGAVEPLEPPLSESGRRFVRRVARVYEQCLEARPAVDPDGPFLCVLQVLAPEAGVRLPACLRSLAPILAGC